MKIPIQRVLHPADLFIARKALDSFQKNREELLLQISNTNYMMFEISFWDKAQWREDRDVPDGRMYYFGIANEQDPRECLDAIIAWLESEIERVEGLLVRFYIEHEVVVHEEMVIDHQSELQSPHQPIFASGEVRGILPGLTMGYGLYSMLHGNHVRGGLFLFGGFVFLIIMVILIRSPKTTCVS